MLLIIILAVLAGSVGSIVIAASSFLYIALADLIPEMHRKTKLHDSAIQIILIVMGIMIIYWIKQIQ